MKTINTIKTGTSHKVVTASIPTKEIELMAEIVEDGWYVSRTELMREALDTYIFKCLHLLFRDELAKFDGEVFENDGKVEVNLEHKSQELNKYFGNPRGVRNGFVFELRYTNTFKPGWVCIGKTEDFEL